MVIESGIIRQIVYFLLVSIESLSVRHLLIYST